MGEKGFYVAESGFLVIENQVWRNIDIQNKKWQFCSQSKQIIAYNCVYIKYQMKKVRWLDIPSIICA